MVCHKFNISGFKCILNTEQLAEYPDCIFSLLVNNSKMTLEKDDEGCIYINRNPTLGKIIYDMIVHDFKFRYLIKLVDKFYLEPVNVDDLISEFQYYNLPMLFTETTTCRTDISFRNGNNYQLALCNQVPNKFEFDVTFLFGQLGIRIDISFMIKYDFSKISHEEYLNMNMNNMIKYVTDISAYISSCTAGKHKIKKVIIDGLGTFDINKININPDLMYRFMERFSFKIIKTTYNQTVYIGHSCSYVTIDNCSFVYDLAGKNN